MNILIGSKSRLLGEGMRMIIGSLFSVSHVAVVEGVKDLSRQLTTKENLTWDIILIDKDLSDFIPPQRLHKLSPKVKVCLLDAESDSQKNAKYYRQGFNGLLLTSSTTSVVEDTVNSLLLGHSTFPGGVNVHTKKPDTKKPKVLNDRPITFRQQEILSLMSMGLSNKEIANHYNLAESTVKRHMSNIFKKLGVQNRVEAVKTASERELLLG